jgi:hypothetical protein
MAFFRARDAAICKSLNTSRNRGFHQFVRRIFLLPSLTEKTIGIASARERAAGQQGSHFPRAMTGSLAKDGKLSA